MRRQPTKRRGIILLLTAFLMVFLVGMVAFAIDLGYVVHVQTEMQRSADAAAVAAAWDLFEATVPGSGTASQTGEIQTARDRAVSYVAANTIAGAAASIDPEDDVAIGYLANGSQTSAAMSFGAGNPYNSVQVTVHKTAGSNGQITLFFARVFEQSGLDSSRQATAAFISNFSGFRTPSDGSNLEILPFALDETTWNDLVAGGGADSWKWNTATGAVVSGGDGVREVNLYPQGTGSPGNRGTVDIGSSNNSTSDLARQIVHGISEADLDYLGGELKFNSQGTLTLNGDTGISAGVKDELASIIGQKRIIPIFSSVTGPGNNAQYTIVKFVGVRILEVKLTGAMSGKKLIVQPANITVTGGIPSSGTQKTFAVYSPVRLVH